MDERHWTRHHDVLLRLIRQPRFGIISDFDGTLSAFATEPGGAVMIPEIVETLDSLAPHVEVVALVSGRGAQDLRARYERPWAVYYGNHGLEFWHGDKVRTAAEAEVWVEPLRALLADFGDTGIPGTFAENKGVTASIHFRMAADPDDAGKRLRARLEPLCERYGFDISAGQYIWEVKPPVMLNKGTAVQAIVEEHRLESALFLGDDITDISAMQRLRDLTADPACSLSALSVGVVHTATAPAIYEACDLIADGVPDVETLLGWVSQHRIPSTLDQNPA